MRRIITLALTLAFTLAAIAQTPQEIISRMEKAMEGHEEDGIEMIVDVKVPIIGTMTTRTWSLGGKSRIEGELMGVTMITWTDGTTKWTYNENDNEIEIDNFNPDAPSDDSGDTDLFNGITDGYDVTIKKEDAKAWYIRCKKSKSNKDKNAPKSMDLAVSKADYFPLSLSASASGLTMTMRGIKFGVSDKQVTFDPGNYPGAKITDKRKK